MTGDICGMQMGLAFATFFSADTSTNSLVLSRYLGMITILMFLALGRASSWCSNCWRPRSRRCPSATCVLTPTPGT
jgi:hypothetical protein